MSANSKLSSFFEMDDGIAYDIAGTPKLSFYEAYDLAREIIRNALRIAHETNFETGNVPETINCFVRLLADLVAKCYELKWSVVNTALEFRIMASRQHQVVVSLGKEFPTALQAVIKLGLTVAKAASDGFDIPRDIPRGKASDYFKNTVFWQTHYRDEFVRAGLYDSVKKWEKFLGQFRKNLPNFDPQKSLTSLWLEQAAAKPVDPVQQTPKPSVEPLGDKTTASPADETAKTTGQAVGDGEDAKPAKVKAAKGKHIDERMAKTLINNPNSVDWTVDDWVEHLNCSKSTVQGTGTWGKIMTMRKGREADKATEHKHYKPTDKRRMGKNRSESG